LGWFGYWRVLVVGWIVVTVVRLAALRHWSGLVWPALWAVIVFLAGPGRSGLGTVAAFRAAGERSSLPEGGPGPHVPQFSTNGALGTVGRWSVTGAASGITGWSSLRGSDDPEHAKSATMGWWMAG
jgi:hypothetical protein